MILYTAADLLWATKIKSTADALGVPCRPVRNIDMLEARLAEGGVRAVLLDLEAEEVTMAVLARLTDAEAEPSGAGVRTLAWGPHVATDRFEAARVAGCDEVMPRGAFSHALPDLLVRLDQA